jgi:hypothetical protein
MFDINKFVAAIFWYRKTRVLLSADDWEQVIAFAKGGEVKGGDTWMADVVTPVSATENETDTVKTIKRLFPNKPSIDQWIIYCRDPKNELISLLATKAAASLKEFNSLFMQEVIIMHEVDPLDPDYYQVIVWIKPQEDYTSFTIEWQRETKNADFYVIDEMTKATFKREKKDASAYQNCLQQNFHLVRTEAVFDERIYSPTHIPSIEEMVRQYELSDNQQ